MSFAIGMAVSCCDRWLPLIARAFSRQLGTSPKASHRVWEVSSHGRICNPRGAISFGSALASGYLRSRMCGEHLYIHRVVAHAFLGPPPSQDAWQVHHKDGDRGNNHSSNLEYVTSSQNASHSFASGTRRRNGPKHSKPVMYRLVSTQAWTTSPSVTAAAAELGAWASEVSLACRRQKQLKGYQFRFANLHELELQGEEWRPMLCTVWGDEVPGRMVSSLGRLRTCFGCVHSGSLHPGGYHLTGYRSRLGLRRTELVHRLVARAFLGPPPSSGRSHVNHKDGDKVNNALVNLEYVTPAENMAHYWGNKTAVRDGSKCRSSAKPVWSRRCDTSDKWTWHPSLTNASQVLGVPRGSVSHCVHGKCHQSGAYEFRAAEFQAFPGEMWREVDVAALVDEKKKRVQCAHSKDHALPYQNSQAVNSPLSGPSAWLEQPSADARDPWSWLETLWTAFLAKF